MKLINTPSVAVDPTAAPVDRPLFPVILDNKEIGTIRLIDVDLYIPYDNNGDDIEVSSNDKGFNMTTAMYLVVLQYLNHKGV